MNIRQFITVFCCLISGIASSQAPTLFNQCDTFFISQDAQIHIFGNCVTSGSTSQLFQNGFIQTYNDQNPGNFELQNSGKVKAGGDFKIRQDWINNGVLQIDSGEVEMYGDNQFFSGDSISSFYDLLLTGTEKKEQEQHIRVRNTLNLTQRELSVHGHFLFIDNPDANAILFDAAFMAEGIISTDEDGIIKKVLHSNELNVIPTGSSENSFRHRPVKIQLIQGTPADTAQVTFHHHSPDLLSAPSMDKDTSLCKIQTEYFYTFKPSENSNHFQLDFASLPSVDGVFPDIARWNNPTWKKIYNQTTIQDINYEYLRANNESGFIEEHYSLAHRTPFAPYILADETECYAQSFVQVETPLNQPWYEWTIGNNPGAVIQDGQGTSSATINWGNVIGGTVTVSYQNSEGCWSFPDTVTIEDVSIQANFQMNSINNENFGSEYRLFNHSTGANSYEWFVGNDMISNEAGNFDHSFTTNGETSSFDVWLVAYNTESGCTDTAYQTITIPALFVFYVPNSFSPDGDGINDSFFAQTSEIQQLKMEIYNRWGELIYLKQGGANATEVYWDGSYNGNPVQTGTYTYVFTVWPANPNVAPTLNYSGSVNVLR